jgi:hypothetical protein
MNWNDVGVLQLSQGLRLITVDRRNLEDHRPIGEVCLFGQENAREGAMPEFMVETKAENLLAILRQFQTTSLALA